MIEIHDRDPPRDVELHRAQHGAKQLQPSHVVAVVHVPRDEQRIDARLEALTANVERPGRNIRVMKRSRVGENRHVDVGGDHRGERNAERADQLEYHLAARGRARVEPVQRPVRRVSRVVIDVDHREAIEAADPGAREVAALHDDRGVEVVLDGRSDADLRHAGELHQRSGRRIGVDDVEGFAHLAERVAHGELRSDGIAIGAGVRRKDEALP